ncbi:MAG TPA: hypothetical protein PLU43_12700, partial [Lachnospiraceae bacterium]|nr:hypothetical protein [Lachnospiraceae bacterium]
PAIFLHLVYNAVPFVIQVLPEAVLLNTVFWLLTPFLLLLIGLFLFRMFGFSFSLRKVSADVSDAVRQ